MSEIYEFADFRLDVRERVLLRLGGGERVALPEKAFDTLCVLVKNGGRLVTKDELLKSVWADSFVEENNLNKSIHAIRRALGEKNGDLKFIETVKKHGFRFVAEVTAITRSGEDKQGSDEVPSSDLKSFEPSVHHSKFASTAHSGRHALATQPSQQRVVKFPELIAANDVISSEELPAKVNSEPSRPRIGSREVAAAAALLLVVFVGAVWVRNRSNISWATAQVPRIRELANSGKTFEAYDLALEVQKYVPADPDLAVVMPWISDTISVTTEPAGANVYLKRYQPDENGTFSERQLIGTTPISGLRIPRGPQIVYLEKEGYAPVQTITSARILKFAYNMLYPLPPIEISRRLVETATMPDKMVYVPGGEYRLASSSRPTDGKITLDDYLIDKYEVSNKDYREFVSAGGYARQEYWKVPVIKDGRTLSWDEAISLFHDRTSLPSPREWSNQDFPTGKDDHPVTGITWYEAAAYAEFRGKKLPTVFQWEKAARNGAHLDAGLKMPWGDLFTGDSIKYRANFDNTGTLPVDSEEFGISEFGAFNMAGNVSEWVLNEGADGYFATGGAWGEPVYTFSYFGVYPGLFESSKRGFRCVRLAAADRAAGDQGAAKLQKDLTVQTYQRTTEAEFREIARIYDYVKIPLDAEVVEAIETADWRREKITFNGAGGKRAIAYLYLPHNAARPLQVIQMMAGSDVESGITPVPLSAEGWLGSVIKSGRALLAVVTEGNSERPWPADFKKPPYDSVEWQDLIVKRFTDYRRGLDYLETRSDIDMTRVGYIGQSLGASQGIILPAVEPRIRSVFLASAGLLTAYKTNQPAANPINFAPHIMQPKLVLNGRFDENFPVKSAVEPMMKLFPEPKELELYDGPHAPQMEVFVPALNRFFDRTLGPVRRQ